MRLDLTDISSLAKIQEEAKRAYYETGQPIMTDVEYDQLIDLNKDTTGIAPQLGRFPVLKHEIPMCSLNKLKQVEEIDFWMQHAGQAPEEYILEPKYDGLSLSLTYNEAGTLEAATLRGDGFQGENVIDNARKFVPLQLAKSLGMRTIVRGEVVISAANWDVLPAGDYANRRNSVSGIIRRLDGKHCEHLDILTYDLEFPTADLSNPKIATFVQATTTLELNKLSTLQMLGFKPSRVWAFSKELLTSLETERDGEYLLDGLVIKHKNSALVREKGVGANGNPILQAAYKFPAEDGVTYITNVTFNLGSTGKIVPVAEVEPVEIQGSKIGKVTLASLKTFKNLDLKIGTKVILRRVNDVIPQIRSRAALQDREEIPVEIPTVCPACGEEVSITANSKGEETELFCTNTNCSGRLIQTLSSALKLLETKGFSESLIKQLVESKMICCLSDFFTITADDVCNGSNMSKVRSEKFIDLRNSRLKAISEVRFLMLFGMEGVAEKSLTNLVAKYKTAEMIADLTKEECIENLKKARGEQFYNSLQRLSSDIQTALFVRETL